MDTELTTIRARWDDLSQDALGDATAARYRIGGTPRFGVFLLVRYPGKTPALELGPLTPDVIKSPSFPIMKGIEFHLAAEAKNHYLAMDLKQVGAVEVFLTLAARLCERLKDVTHPITAYNTIHDVLIQWQSFFSPDRRILTDSQQIGLAGELIFMDILINDGLNQQSALKSWRGSERSHHDFHFQNLSVEVKSTTAVKTDEVSISNLRQLEKVGADQLFLAQVMLDIHENGASTLPDLVSLVRHRYSVIGSEQLCLEEKLVRAGYRTEDEGQYSSRSYTLRSVRSFSVDDDFPKITTSEVSEGVLEASYKISIAGIKSKALSIEHITGLLKDKASE